MKKYSDILINDDNFDEEYEKLLKYFNYNKELYTYEEFVDKLDNSFTKQNNNGIEEWISYNISSDITHNFNQVIQSGYLAYEFGNGFLILNYIYYL